MKLLARIITLLILSLLIIDPCVAQSKHEISVSETAFRLDGTPPPFTGISFFNAIYNPHFNQSPEERTKWLKTFQRDSMPQP